MSFVLVKCPYRISLFGGGTDYPAWSKEHGGSVLSTTIDKYCWLTVRRFPPYQPYAYRVIYSKVEHVDSVASIQHPAVRACLEFLPVDGGLAIGHDGDLPARCGMGSSSAFTVGLLHALHALRGEVVSKAQLSREAIHVEQAVLKENVGAQDQVAVAHGGFNRIEFLRDGGIHTQPIPVGRDILAALESHLYLYYLGPRPAGATASTIAATYDFDTKRPHLRAMAAMVNEALDALARGDLDAIGSLLHDSWRMKRELGGVSSPEIDAAYEAARAAGATGGKCLGAGSGGFLLFYAPGNPDALHEAILSNRPDRMRVPFKFEREGSSLVYYAP